MQHRVESVGSIPFEEGSAQLDGRRNWIEAPHVPLNGRPFAVAFWLQEMTHERAVGLVEQFDRNARRSHLHLMLRGNRQPYFGFLGSDLASPVGIPRDGSWVHLIFQYTGTHQQIWIDGHLVCTRETPPYDGEMGVTAIGKAPRWANVQATDLVGRMRDFRIYPRMLSSAEVGALSRETQTAPVGAGSTSKVASPPKRQARAQSGTWTAMMPADTGLPFLRIEAEQLIINGRSGQVYSLLHSQSLSSWKPLLRLTNDTGTITLTPTQLPQMSSGFFFVEVVE